MATKVHTSTIIDVRCWCGVWHAIPTSLNREASERGTMVWCPLGHQWTYAETETERVKAELARERAWHDQTRADRDRIERSLVATKGVVTRTKRRVAHGVCPCCKRTFANMARHMAGQHPEYAP